MPLLPDTEFLIQALPLLLHDHDCLVVPGLGGFVAHPISARYDENKGEWVPPGRNVAFNPKLTVRDGLLEQEIRRATGCTNDAATALIDREVEVLKHRLSAGQTQEIPGLGRLYMRAASQMAFAPEPRIGERYAAPGLGRIAWSDRQSESTGQSEQEPQPTTAVPLTPSATETASWPPLLRIAAVLMLPVLVGGTLWWGNQQDTRFELLSVAEPASSLYMPRIDGEDIRFPERSESESLSFVDAAAPWLSPPSAEAMMPIPEATGLASGCTHHVIAGTFSEVGRAAALARRFESLGYATSILPGPNGNQRVSAGCFNNGRDAARFRQGLKDHHGIEQAWILNL